LGSRPPSSSQGALMFVIATWSITIRIFNYLCVLAAAPMLLSLSVAGLPFVGADVGGFFGEPSAELFTRCAIG
jgi:hypothetical protein